MKTSSRPTTGVAEEGFNAAPPPNPSLPLNLATGKGGRALEDIAAVENHPVSASSSGVLPADALHVAVPPRDLQRAGEEEIIVDSQEARDLALEDLSFLDDLMLQAS